MHSVFFRVHPEDNLWYALSSYERREVLDAMRPGVPKRTSDDSGRGMQPQAPEDDTEWFGDGDDDIEATTRGKGLIYYDVEDYDDNDDGFDFGGEDDKVRK